MKNMKHKMNIAAIAIIIIFSSSYIGCKKGDGDPFISLKSRKARVEGDWKVTMYKATGSYSSGGSSPNTQSYSETYDGTTWTTNVTSNGTVLTPSSSAVTYTYSFTKDGTYKMHKDELPAGGTTKTIRDEEGTWNFLAGVGDAKNKEFLSLIVTKSTIVSGNVTSTNIYDTRTGSVSTWQINTLKNKEMVVQWDNNYSDDSGYKDDDTYEMTLTQ